MSEIRELSEHEVELVVGGEAQPVSPPPPPKDDVGGLVAGGG